MGEEKITNRESFCNQRVPMFCAGLAAKDPTLAAKSDIPNVPVKVSGIISLLKPTVLL